MADLQSFGRALAGFGAGVQGQGPQFLQGLDNRRRVDLQEKEKLSQERRQALLIDNRSALRMLEAGDAPGAIKLLDERIGMISELGANPKDTTEFRDLIASGDINKAMRLSSEIDSRAVDAGLLEARPGAGSSEFSKAPGTIVELEDGTKAYSIPVMNKQTGMIENQVVPIDGKLISRMGESAEAQTLREIRETQLKTRAKELEEREAAADKASETKRGGAQQTRAQGFIDSGLVAADSVPIAMRGLELLKTVKTGGINALANAVNSTLGIQSADELELSNALSRNVLAQLRDTFGAAFTAQEGKQLSNISEGFGKSTAGNIRLLERAVKLARRTAERGIRAAEKNGDFGAADEIRAALEFTVSAPKNAPESKAEALKTIQTLSQDELNAMSFEELEVLRKQAAGE